MTTKRTARAEQLEAFNSKLAAIKSEPAEQHRASYPDFAAIERRQEAELKQRMQETKQRNHVEATKSHVPLRAADQRGPGAVALPCKRDFPNLATKTSELSVPIQDKKVAEYTAKLAKEGPRALCKKTSWECKVEEHLRLTVGSNFSSSLAKTGRGWKPGCFG